MESAKSVWEKINDEIDGDSLSDEELIPESKFRSWEEDRIKMEEEFKDWFFNAAKRWNIN